MKRKIKIKINREDKKEHVIEEDKNNIDSEVDDIQDVEVTPLSGEGLYAKELEIVLEEYIKFTKTYKDIAKQLMNPIKMKRNAEKIYKQLSDLSVRFNMTINTFKERAIPTDDLQEIHNKLIKSLEYFEIYNDEFPELMMNGDFKRINEVSKGLDLGHKGIKEVFDELEEREKNKTP